MTDPNAPASSDSAAVQAAQLIAHLQGVTQALAAVRQQDEVFGIILNDALSALQGIAGAVLLVEGSQLYVAARRGHDGASVWQGSALIDPRPGTDALRSNTPLFFNDSGDLARAYPELELYTGGVAAVASAVLPMVENGHPLGVIVLDFREPHDFTLDEEHFLLTLAGQCALALDRVRLSGNLEQQVQDRTAELAAFVRFTELADGETNVLALAARAEEILSVLFPGCTNGYYALEDGLWKLKVHSSDLQTDLPLLASLKAGMPLDTPVFAQAMRTGEPVFVDAWDPAREQFARTEAYQRISTYPLRVDGTIQAIFALGLKDTPHWTAHHKAVFRSVGRSLKLALERTETTRQLGIQNTELQARTQALEGFAELTRDLGLNSDAALLTRRALNLVLSLLPPGYAAFWQVVGGRWRLAGQVGEVGKPELQDAINAGFPTGLTPTLDLPYQMREPLFQDHYDPERDTDPELVNHLSTVATLPVIVNGNVLGVFNAALFGPRLWSAADRAVLITTAQSLGLALERTEQARQLTAQRDLLQASNEELEAFTYSVSHDLRTPVRHIIGFGSLLRRSLPGPLGDKTERYLGIVETAAHTLNQLLDGILDLSRTSRQPLTLAAVDLSRLVAAVRKEVMAAQPESTVQSEATGQSEGTAQPSHTAQPDHTAQLNHTAQPDHTVTWQVAELPTVLADADLLRRVMLALMSNAVKYTQARERAIIEIWAEEQSQTWTVWVRDNGVGFDPQYQGKLFTAFQRLHRQTEFGGAGVSLANVRRILTRHGGSVFAQGQLGVGASFGFSLPKTGEDSSAPI